MNIQLVLKLATSLRKAMEIADFTGCASSLATFPFDCCSHASSLLLILFYEHSIDGFRLMQGRHPDLNDGGHEWIQSDNIVVDITADQFAELQLPAVLVGNSAWHQTLNPLPQRDALHEFDIPYYKSQTQIYGRVMATGHIPINPATSMLG